MIKILLKNLAGARAAILFMFLVLLAAGAVGQESSSDGETVTVVPQYPADQLPTVTSDKEDYSPGETAIITFQGWTRDSVIDVHFEEEPTHEHHHGYHDQKVGSDGSFEIRYPIEERHVGVAFTVIAVGKTTKYEARTFFTDAGIADVSVSKSSYCSDGEISVSFLAAANSGPVNGGFDNDNKFIAEISDENGNFTDAVQIGSITAKHDNNNKQIISLLNALI